MSEAFFKEADSFGFQGVLAVKEHFEIAFPDATVEVVQLPAGARDPNIAVRKSVSDDGDLRMIRAGETFTLEAKRRRNLFRADGTIRYPTIFCGNKEHVQRVKPWCTVIVSEDLVWGAFVYAHMLDMGTVSVRNNKQPEGHTSQQCAVEVPSHVPSVMRLNKRAR